MARPQKKRYSYNNRANRIYTVDKSGDDISYTVGVPDVSYLTYQPPKKVKKKTRKKVKKYKRKRGVKKGTKKKLYSVLDWGGSRQVSWPTYIEAKSMVQARGIRSRIQYIDWLRSHRVRYLPSNPNVVYVDEWEGWAKFCNTNNVAKGENDKTVYLPFWQAAKWVQGLGLDSSLAWRRYIKVNELPEGICRNPARVYRDIWKKEVDWDHWLGKSVVGIVEVAKKVEQLYLWYIVSKGDDFNYFEVVKCLEGVSVGGYIHGRYRFEKEYEDWLWGYLDSVSEPWEGKGSRKTVNIYMVIEGLDHQLLKVR